MIEWLGVVACGNDGTGWNAGWQTFECEVLELTNQRRAQGASCGGTRMPPVGPLSRQQQLTSSARAHAKDMGDRNYFAHDSLDGRSPFDRMQAAGFSGLTMAENISAGQPSPRQVVDGWMSSPGHCANIMNASVTSLGVGYYHATSGKFRHMWVQNFGGGGSAGGLAPRPPAQQPPRQAPRPATSCLSIEQVFAAAPCFFVHGDRYDGPKELLRGLDPDRVVQFCRQTLAEGYFAQPLCDENIAPPPPACITADQRRVLEYCATRGFQGDDPVANWLCWFGLKAPERLRQWISTQDCAVEPSLPPVLLREPPAASPSPARSVAVPLAVAAAIGGALWFLS
jgi:hypothetical protein